MAILHTFLTKGNKLTTKELTRGKAIRQKCLECSAWNTAEVRNCPARDCALWVFRMGRVAKIDSTSDFDAQAHDLETEDKKTYQSMG